ncbi:MAG TPA: SIS domain-containing protein [Bacteroidales bacterium]|nr:SIS domain-containing protein [Bacteroidales bacterium]
MKAITVPADLIRRYPELSVVEVEIAKAAECLVRCFSNSGKLLICGNGGSSSDAGHIAGELMKGFEHRRPLGEALAGRLSAYGERGKYIASKLQQGFPVISLSAHTVLMTAVANDIDPDLVFAQQVGVYGNKGDVLLAISTSGNSKNIIDSIITASAKEMTVIGMTGETGGAMKAKCDILINVPGTRTSAVQELHLPVYHAICLMVENYFFSSKS